MSTSADKKIFYKRAFVYLCIAAFLVVFNLVYGLFAHGVASGYMQFAFLFPLVGGSAVSLVMIFLPAAGRIVRELWRMGIATLSVGSLLHGVFDIYGSTAPLVLVFFIAGGILHGSAFLLYVCQAVRAGRRTSA